MRILHLYCKFAVNRYSEMMPSPGFRIVRWFVRCPESFAVLTRLFFCLAVGRRGVFAGVGKGVAIGNHGKVHVAGDVIEDAKAAVVVVLAKVVQVKAGGQALRECCA